jgi:hypothetical protein
MTTSRRDLLKTFAVGAAVAGTTGAVTVAVQHAFVQDGPAPWWLFSPLGRGTSLALGWYVHDLSAVVKGASVLTLRSSSGSEASIHLCAHNGSPRGIAYTELVDFVLMDGRNANARTDERLGRIVLGLGKLVARNETNPNGDLWPLANMLTHAERVELFGPEDIS